MPRARAASFWSRTAAITLKDDPEFAIFPPHCVKGTPGANLVPEALTEKVVTVPNEAAASLPADLSRYQQILLEKQTLNIFESRHADELVKRLGPNVEFVVFGVVTEFCVASPPRVCSSADAASRWFGTRSKP